MTEPQQPQRGLPDFLTSAPFEMKDIQRAIDVVEKGLPDGDIVIDLPRATRKQDRYEFILEDLNAAYKLWLMEAGWFRRKRKREVRESLDRIKTNFEKLRREPEDFTLTVTEPKDALPGYSRAGFIYLSRAEAEITGYTVGDPLTLFGELAIGIEDTAPELVTRRIKGVIAALETATERAQIDCFASPDTKRSANLPYERFLSRAANTWGIAFDEKPRSGTYNAHAKHPHARTYGSFLDFIYECLHTLDEKHALDGLLDAAPKPEALRQRLRKVFETKG